ncbi:hypothetical protein QCA50_009520 [Cerrena zonata]|uniref:Uncharacterized protein n=1 Tax=Cerrena zonata TaxID=2478898 RepID=A0AAW0G1E4_9APHY
MPRWPRALRLGRSTAPTQSKEPVSFLEEAIKDQPKGFEPDGSKVSDALIRQIEFDFLQEERAAGRDILCER